MTLFSFRLDTSVILPTVLILTAAMGAVAQSSPTPVTSTPAPSATQSTAVKTDSPVVTASSSSTPDSAAPVEDSTQVNPVLRRIERAAAHQLQQAATDLENIRVSANDVALRNVTTLMLIGVYLEEGNYARAQTLLEESFAARKTQNDESIRTYFAMVGQTINGIRTHLSRYRTFGINPSDGNLPVEANTDLDRVRVLLERVVAQAKEISGDSGRSYEALALQEDVLGLRLSLAREGADREKWQGEYVAVREKLASSQVQVASIGRPAVLDAMTARIPNPFSPKPAEQTQNTTNTGSQPVTSTASNAASTEGPEPKLISSGSLNGKETKRVTPSYPAVAKTTGVAGTVRVFAIVDENGKVWVTNSEGPTLLRRAAEDAAKGWIFPPTMVSGKPVRVAGYLDFDFKL